VSVVEVATSPFNFDFFDFLDFFSTDGVSADADSDNAAGASAASCNVSAHRFRDSTRCTRTVFFFLFLLSF